jgi:hypothetical protein
VKGLLYIVVQCLGGLTGAGLLKAVVASTEGLRGRGAACGGAAAAAAARSRRRGRSPTRSTSTSSIDFSELFRNLASQVLKQVHPGTGVSTKAMPIMNSFVNNLLTFGKRNQLETAVPAAAGERKQELEAKPCKAYLCLAEVSIKTN